jgi:hypothetical protein
VIPPDFPWPRLGDVAFDAGPDPTMDARLARASSPRAIAVGYKTASDLLVDVVKTNRVDLDVLVFPIAFGYRQCLELLLKRLIAVGQLAVGDEPAVKGLHSLVVLWLDARSVLERAWPDPSPETKDDLDAVGAVLGQFDAIDRNSDGFRFSVNRKGAPALPASLHTVNLERLRDVVARVANSSSPRPMPSPRPLPSARCRTRSRCPRSSALVSTRFRRRSISAINRSTSPERRPRSTTALVRVRSAPCHPRSIEAVCSTAPATDRAVRASPLTSADLPAS